MNMFDIKHGLIPRQDYMLPRRFFTPHREGGAACVKIPLEGMMGEYYAERGWPDGIPSPTKLRELGLDFCIKP